MSTKQMRLWLGFAVVALFIATPSRAAAQTEQRIAVPLSDPARPATVDVSLLAGSIAVTAYEGNEIVIVVRDAVDGEADEDEDDDDVEEDEDADDQDSANVAGLRRIPNTSIGLTAEERDNTVEIRMDFTRREVDLEISVPRRTSVHAATVQGGLLTVTGVSGDHELSNVNGAIVATDIAGAAVVGTTNGDVRVSFTELTPDKAMSFSSFNGNVDVTLPANLSADLRVNSGQGDLLTDFDVEVLPQSPVVERGGDRGRYQVRMEREMSAVVGGGGPELHFKTFNGDIMIRKGR